MSNVVEIDVEDVPRLLSEGTVEEHKDLGHSIVFIMLRTDGRKVVCVQPAFGRPYYVVT